MSNSKDAAKVPAKVSSLRPRITGMTGSTKEGKKKVTNPKETSSASSSSSSSASKQHKIPSASEGSDGDDDEETSDVTSELGGVLSEPSSSPTGSVSVEEYFKLQEQKDSAIEQIAKQQEQLTTQTQIMLQMQNEMLMLRNMMTQMKDSLLVQKFPETPSSTKVEVIAAAFGTPATKIENKSSTSSSSSSSSSSSTTFPSNYTKSFSKKTEEEYDEENDQADHASDKASMSKEHSNPYQYYMAYLEERQRIYPIKEHWEKYSSRNSLLTPIGREQEYYRFGLEVDFDTRLYPSWFVRYYNYRRDEVDLPLVGAQMSVRPVSPSKKPHIIMTYAKEDITDMGDDGEIELKEGCVTLSTLPLELQHHPSHGSERLLSQQSRTIEEWVSWKLTKLQTEEQVKYETSLRKYAADRAAKVKGETMPSLDRVDGHHDTKQVIYTPHTSTQPQIQHKSDPAASYPTSSMPSATTLSSQPASLPVNPHHPIPHSGVVASTTLVSPTSNGSILIPLLGELPEDLQIQITSLIERSMSTVDTNRFVNKEKLKKVPEPPTKFNGQNHQDAPSHFAWWLTTIAKYSFTTSEALTTLDESLTQTASAWFRTNRSTIDRLPLHEQMLELYRKIKMEYLNETYSLQYENELKSCILTKAVVNAVDSHYQKFTSLLYNLRMCKPYVPEAEVMRIYFLSLPQSLRDNINMYIYQQQKHITHLYAIVRSKAVHDSLSTSKQEEPINIANNAQSTSTAAERYDRRRRKQKFSNSKSNQNEKRDVEEDTDVGEQQVNNNKGGQGAHSTNRQDKQWKKLDNKNLVCFHCGAKGHMANRGECAAWNAKRPQNAIGKIAWAQYAAASGITDEYDPRFRDISAATDNNNNSAPTSTRYSKKYNNKNKPIDVVSEAHNINISPYKSYKQHGSSDMSASDEDSNSGLSDYEAAMEDSVDSDIENMCKQQSAVQVKVNRLVTSTAAEEEQIGQLIDEEKEKGYQLLVKIEIEGKECMPMLDQGCTSTLCRQSYLNQCWPTIKQYPLPPGSVVTSSSGHRIPMHTCVKVNIKIGETTIKDVVMFVVDDQGQYDICADMILGKTYLGKANVWMNMSDDIIMILHGGDPEYISCIPGCTTTVKRQDRWRKIVIPKPNVISKTPKQHKQQQHTLAMLQDEVISKNNQVTASVKSVTFKDQPEVKESSENRYNYSSSDSDEIISQRAVTINNNNTNKNDNNLESKQRKSLKQTELLTKEKANKKKDQPKKGHDLRTALEAAITSHQQTDKSLTSDMKELVKEKILSQPHKYKLVSTDQHRQMMLAYTMFEEDSTTVVNENEERIKAYFHAYNSIAGKGPDKREESIILDQLLNLPFGSNAEEEDSMEEDPAMQTVEQIDDLGSTPRIADTPELREERKKAIIDKIQASKHLSVTEKQKVIKVLTSETWLNVTSLKGENFKQVKSVQHEINTEATAKPFRQKLRNYSMPLQMIIDAEVERIMSEGLVVPSTSPYASNLLLVRKPDPSSPGGIKNRVCVNFIQLNKQTIKDAYPMANPGVMFDEVAKAKWFTTCDLMSGYWQVLIKPEHRHKTAFLTKRGLYEWIVMPFGLCNAPGTFQRLMDEVILPEYRSFLQSYVDDIIVYSKTLEEHLKHLKQLADLLHQHGLTVKLNKCEFVLWEIKFLGHLLSEGQIKPNPAKIEQVKDMVKPINVKGVRSFVSTVGWYRRFVPRFAEIAQPLFNLTKKNAEFRWTAECQSAFDLLKQALITEPVLAAADPYKDYYLNTDANDVCIAAALQQEDKDGVMHPIAYASKLMNAAQRNYSVSEKECLALVWALEHFNTYVEGHEYTCLTDHAALTHLINNKESKNQRITRWVLRLQPYHLRIQYIKGSKNNLADLLSRKHEMMKVSGKDEVNAQSNEMHISLKSNDDIVNDAELDSNSDESNCLSKLAVFTYMNAGRVRPKRERKPVYRTRSKTHRGEYEVSAIINKRLIDGEKNKYEYEVKWMGSDNTTWEPLEYLKNSMNKVMEYEQERRVVLQQEADVIQEQQLVRLPVEYKCDTCEYHTYNLSNYHIHRYREHEIAMPKLDSEINIIEETNKEVIKTFQRTDTALDYIFDSDLGERILDHFTPLQKRELLSHEFVFDEDGLLYIMDIPTASTRVRTRANMKLVVPRQMRQKIIKEMHEGALSSHSGINNTCDKMNDFVWWPHMRADIVRYITSCTLCQRAKKYRQQSVLPRSVAVSSSPFSLVGLDIMGPLPTTMHGNSYVLTMVDHFTRFGDAVALKDTESLTIASAVISMWICKYGLFDVMVSDNGVQLVSDIAKYIYKQLGIKRKVTTTFHPQSNGITERFNGTLKQLLKIWCNEEQDDWDELLPYALFVYNSSFHRVIQEVPFYVKEGRIPKQPIDIIINKTREQYDNVHVYADELVQKLRRVQDRVQEIYQSINSERQEELDLQEKKEIQYNVGDKVWLFDPTTKAGKSRKLTHRWIGPYTVTTKKSDVLFMIEKENDKQLVNKTRLRKYINTEDKTVQLENDYDVLHEEVAALKKTQVELLAQQQYKEQQLELARARMVVEAEPSQQANNNQQEVMVASDSIDVITNNTKWYAYEMNAAQYW